MSEQEIHPLAQAVIDAHDAIAPKMADAKRSHIIDLLETFEQDIYPIVAPFVQPIIDHPDTPDHVKAILAPLADPQHFGESVVIGIAVGSIVSPVLQAGLEPLLIGLGKAAWQAAFAGGDPLAGRPIPVDVAVAAALKNVTSPYNPENEAALQGISNARFAQMVNAAGNSMGIAEAITLQRRNQLAPITLDEVLHYSNTNPFFYGPYANLLEAWPTIGEVLTGRLKGHLDDTSARELYAAQGGRKDDYPWLLASLGRPPGTMEMLDLWNKSAAGLIGTNVDAAVVEQSVKQSDINDDYWPYIQELRHYFPPPRSVVPMLRAEAITEAEARQLLIGYGVGEPWLSAFIKEGTKTATSHVKTLSQAQIVSSYEERLLDRPTALARLEALKYDAADATALLDLADEKRKTALMNATVSMVGRRYVNYKLAKSDATHYLASAGVPNAAQLDLFKLWDIERQANVHVLTPASIVGAFRRGEITAHDCQTRLLQGGIATEDLAIVVADGFAPTKPRPDAVLMVVEGADSYINP